MCMCMRVCVCVFTVPVFLYKRGRKVNIHFLNNQHLYRIPRVYTHCTLYIVHCILYIVHCILYTVYMETTLCMCIS